LVEGGEKGGSLLTVFVEGLSGLLEFCILGTSDMGFSVPSSKLAVLLEAARPFFEFWGMRGAELVVETLFVDPVWCGVQ
jgi:hypothetical protein